MLMTTKRASAQNFRILPVRFWGVFTLIWACSLMLAFALVFASRASAEDFTAKQTRLLAEARQAFAADATDSDALIWTGRRLGYLERYDEAMAAFAQGETLFPDDARFPRHRGHRLISVRRFAEAEAALQKAAEMMAARPNQTEPDGLPNAAGVPTSTLKGNIYYHLALARYLQRNYAGAADAWAGAAALAANVDSASASRYWLYLSRAQAGDAKGAAAALAPVRADWALLENHDYQRLALCFKGVADCGALEDEAMAATGVGASTVLYGLGAKAHLDQDLATARRFYEQAVSTGAPASFGYIAAETALAELNGAGRQ